MQNTRCMKIGFWFCRPICALITGADTVFALFFEDARTIIYFFGRVLAGAGNGGLAELKTVGQNVVHLKDTAANARQATRGFPVVLEW